MSLEGQGLQTFGGRDLPGFLPGYPGAPKSLLWGPKLGSAPPGTGPPGPFRPGTPEESKRVPKESPGAAPQGPRRVRPGVSKESEKSPKVRVLDSFRTLLRLGAHSSQTLGAHLGGLFRDSFQTLPGFRAANANANSDAPRKFASELWQSRPKEKAAN